jgi:hypothetical protein
MIAKFESEEFEYGNFECERFSDAKKLNARFECEKLWLQNLNMEILNVKNF